MKIGGMGEEALVVLLGNIRRLNELPADVEIVRVLPPPKHINEYGPEWVSRQAPFPPLYLHIRHRYCVRVPISAPLMYDHLDNFLKRYRELAQDEKDKKGIPVNQDSYSVWVGDDA